LKRHAEEEICKKTLKPVDNLGVVAKNDLTMRQKESKKNCKKSVDTPDAI
jgi:hypothetical protein